MYRKHWHLSCLRTMTGSRDGIVVIAHISHLRGRGAGHEWVKLDVGSLLCSKRFFSMFSGFPLSQMQDLPENHFWVSGASWVNINNYNATLKEKNQELSEQVNNLFKEIHQLKEHNTEHSSSPDHDQCRINRSNFAVFWWCAWWVSNLPSRCG